MEPISAWYELPPALQTQATKTYDLREIRISPDKALISGIASEYFPLATPMPTPQNEKTPWPDDPRGNGGLSGAQHAAHSVYGFSGEIEGGILVYDIQNELSRYYLHNEGRWACTRSLADVLAKGQLYGEYMDPNCGRIGGGAPLHFRVNVKEIDFSGGKGVRYLIASGNYQTVNNLIYIFQGLSDDGRYYLKASVIVYHPYIVDSSYSELDFGPFLAWKEGQYDEAEKSYDVFNQRIDELLEAEVVTLYPDLKFLDEMMASIVIK